LSEFLDLRSVKYGNILDVLICSEQLHRKYLHLFS